ncbi:MAG: hypothetical protein WEA58_03260 [Balneolaceae bacterium]
MQKTVLTITLFLFPLFTFAQTNINELEPKQYFDFWVGEWEVSWDEGEGKTGKGTNIVEKTLDGTVIQENFRILEGGNKGFKGTSISVYQPRLERWKQAWADNTGGYFDFTGEIEGEKRIFQTAVSEMEDGRQFTQRMVFYDISEKSMTWDWESSDDSGTTWTLNWRINYERMR